MDTGLSKSYSVDDVIERFLSSVREGVVRHSMLGCGEMVVAGVSGGADSVALLCALHRLKDELKIDLIAAHLNHGIRGEEADRDAEFVRELAARLDVACVIEKVDVPKLRTRMRMGLEEAARKVRYDFLETVAASARRGRIAVAHTADDQAETVLLNIIRGAGPAGLAGMPPVRGRIVRPLIHLFRADVIAYLQAAGQDWRTDATNLSADRTRNRVRLKLLPYLAEKFNPRIKDALLSLSELVREESEVVAQAAADTFQDISTRTGTESVSLDAEALKTAPRAVQRRCLRMAIELVKGDLVDVEFEQVERALEMSAGGQDFTLTLPTGLVYAGLTGGELRVFKNAPPKTANVDREMAVPGRTEVPELGVAFETQTTVVTDRPETASDAVIDMDKVSGPLRIRTWKPGDRVAPLGMAGQKKLHDLFIDRKIPRPERGLIPVVVDDEKVVWVVG